MLPNKKNKQIYASRCALKEYHPISQLVFFSLSLSFHRSFTFYDGVKIAVTYVHVGRIGG